MIEKPLVFIEWVDSQVLMGWQYEDVMKPLLPDTCYSVGFLIDNNAYYKTKNRGYSQYDFLLQTNDKSFVWKIITKKIKK